MNSGILLSVREKATRLPGKVLKPLGGYDVTECLLRRLQGSRLAQQVIVATSTDPRDQVLVDIAAKVGAGAFKGSEDDKLVRYRDAARQFGFDFVVIVDGDDPFCSVEHIDALIARAAEVPVDFVVWDGLPLGATGFGVRTRALEMVCQRKKEQNTEIWGHLFLKDPAFRCEALKEGRPLFNRPDVRMTLDYPEDYTFFKTVADALVGAGKDLSFENIMVFLKDHPEVVAVNQNVQKAYEEHLRKSRDSASAGK